MALFKCKMCGGALEVTDGATIIECGYCGTQQTLPKLDDEKRANMYDRANHFRRNNEFDTAMGIYEQILNEDKTDAEAYWSIVLCRFGVEYVEDPYSLKRIPTINRTQYTSILNDADYKSALEYADLLQRTIYEREAKEISGIQKSILDISQKEKPFDVFICYKETDANGRRTIDSVLAQDLYDQLTKNHLRVFFSRITLEDKLGIAYEPYIFAALNSAKVMIVLGTKSEHFNAVWVKNEWSRYLSIANQSKGEKVLIPAYRDMDPYDLPREFSHLQGQDMSKIGFVQDLVRGIKKIVEVAVPKEAEKSIGTTVATSNTASLLKRALIFLEDEKWEEADAYAERVLDLDPENAEAYLVKFLADVEITHEALIVRELEKSDYLTGSADFQKALRFGDDNLRKKLQDYIKAIDDRFSEEQVQDVYEQAHINMTKKTHDGFLKAAELFSSISSYLDSEQMIQECRENAEECRKNDIYINAVAKIEKLNASETAISEAMNLFNSISGWKDADNQIAKCEVKLRELEKNKEKQRIAIDKKKKARKITIISIRTIVCVLLITFLAIWFFVPIYSYTPYENGYSISKWSQIFITHVDIPSEYKGKPVVRIEKDAFARYPNLETVTIPDSVTSIDEYAFYNCTSLTSIVIPDSVTSIGEHAFSNCTSLTSIVIPDSVTSIGEHAFSNCTSLTVYCEATSKPNRWSSNWNASNRPVVWSYTVN